MVTSIAVAPNAIYVADFTSKRIAFFDRAGHPTGFLAGAGRFDVPSPYFPVSISADGQVWVANPGEHRVEGYRNGALTAKWGSAGAAIEKFCGCCNPGYLAPCPLPTGGQGWLTSEKGTPRVKVYDRTGRLIGVVAGPEQFEPGSRGLAVAAAATGRVFVLDPRRAAVRVFDLKGA